MPAWRLLGRDDAGDELLGARWLATKLGQVDVEPDVVAASRVGPPARNAAGEVPGPVCASGAPPSRSWSDSEPHPAGPGFMFKRRVPAEVHKQPGNVSPLLYRYRCGA